MRTFLATAALWMTTAASAATFNIDLSAPTFTAEANRIVAEVGGVTVTGEGFVAEIDGETETVIGPFPVVSSIFEPGLSLNTFGLGLSAEPIPGFDLSGSDRGFGNFSPGFNGGYIDTSLPKTDFLVLTFSQPVDVGSVIVSRVSNFSRSLWMAYGSTEPVFSAGFSAGLASLSWVESPDTGSGSDFAHALGASAISSLVIGAPFREGGSAMSQDHFYIVGLGDVALAPGSGGTGPETPGPGTGPGTEPGPAPIPLPASGVLLGLALAALAGHRLRRRPRA